MPEGSCLCRNLGISFTGEPNLNALCHCLDCRKISGSILSIDIIVSQDRFTLHKGTPKKYSKLTQSGNTITSFFCGNCGTTLWRESTGFLGVKIVKGGTLDQISEFKPTVELFCSSRIDWLPDIEGIKQLQGMQ